LLGLAITLIAATTMIPVGIRHPSLRFVDNQFHPYDVVNNLILYAPLGIALAGSSLLRVSLCGLGLASLAEFLQFFSIDRTPSVADVVCNTLGAVVGYAVARVLFPRRIKGPVWIALPRWLAIAAIPAAILGTLMLLHNRPAYDFSNWNPYYQLAVGNELDGGRTWNGTISALAIYPVAMSTSEVEVLSRLRKVFPVATGQTPVFGPLSDEDLKTRFGQPLLSPEQQRQLYDTLTTSNQITVLVAMMTPNVQQSGPARIVTYSANAWGRNFTLGQNVNGLTFRLRTPSSGGNGTDPALYTGPVLEANRTTMVAAVYDGRFSRLYVDGKLMAQLDLASRRPRLPRRVVMLMPKELPLREVEMVTVEILLAALLAVGLFGQFGIPRRLWNRYLLGAAAGGVVAVIVCAFAVSRAGLAMHIVAECVGAGLVVSASVEPQKKSIFQHDSSSLNCHPESL
jgi:VanZ like family/Concanavalin A-like lectin/glucanases superfamily